MSKLGYIPLYIAIALVLYAIGQIFLSPLLAELIQLWEVII